jgi:hypothetical protein
MARKAADVPFSGAEPAPPVLSQGQMPSVATALMIFLVALSPLYLWKSKLNVVVAVAAGAVAGGLSFGLPSTGN